MGSGIYIATSGAVAQDTALDVTSNNIANASTAGFKGQRVSFGEALATAQSDDARFVGTERISTDHSQGHLRQTGNPLDLGLSGPGYFEMETPDGLRYSRAGDFRLDESGKLVNGTGYAVRSTTGGPITIPDGSADVVVESNGAVFADGNEVGTISLVRFEQTDLVRVGDNLYSDEGATRIEGAPEVIAGTIEQSNVNAVRGMVNMVKISRTYQALVRMIESYKAIDERTARALGGPK